MIAKFLAVFVASVPAHFWETDLNATISGTHATLELVLQNHRGAEFCVEPGFAYDAQFLAADGTPIAFTRGEMPKPPYTYFRMRGDTPEQDVTLRGDVTFASEADARRVAKVVYDLATYDCMNLIVGREKVGIAMTLVAVPVFKP